MGTPEFAVPSLAILLEHGYDIVGVITSPDKYGGRGRKQLIESEIKKYAKKKNLNILQPTNLKDQEFIKRLKGLKADLQVVVAFRMLPEVVWNMPPLGTYNLHASLLPAFRGAAPINWAIISGAEETGVTTFKLKHEIDTGDLAFQEKIHISFNDTAGSLHDKLMNIGASLVLKTVKSIADDSLSLYSQDQKEVTKAPKIFHETCEMDFNKPVEELYNHVRGLSPYPMAWMWYLGKKMKLSAVIMIVEKHNHEIGKIISDYKTYMHLVCKGGYLELIEIQYEGKRKMTVKDFLNGMGVRMKTE